MISVCSCERAGAGDTALFIYRNARSSSNNNTKNNNQGITNTKIINTLTVSTKSIFIMII